MSMIRKGLAVLLLVVVLLFVLGLTFGADTLFRHAMQSGAEAALGAPVSIEDTELSLFSGSAAISGFHGGTEKSPLLDFSEARFDVSVGAALDGRAHIEQATLEGLRIHLLIDEQGKLSWDSGPPPADAPKAEAPPQTAPDATPPPPPEEQDLTQVLQAYWLRYQEYKPYYDEHGGFFGGGGESEEEEAARQRARWPGKPDAVAAAQSADAAATEARGAFWIDQAAIEDFAWNTLDERTGKPLLPALASGSLRMNAIGTPPDGSSPASGLAGEAKLVNGGDLSFNWSGSRDGSPSGLALTASAISVQDLLPLAGASFPYDVIGGTLAVGTDDLAFAKDHLSGTIRLELADGQLSARADSPEVLGVDAKEFCSLLNTALGSQPVAFVIELGGTPAAPKFKISNATDLGDMLGGAIKAEAERLAREFVDEQTAELENLVDTEKAELERKAAEEKAELQRKADAEKAKLEEKAKEGLGRIIGGGK